MQGLKLLVIGLGIAILAVLGVIIVAISQRLDGAGGGAAGSDGAAFGELQVPVPAGCTLAEGRLDEDRLLLRFQGPADQGCQQLVVIDPESGKVLGRVTASPTP